MKIKLLFIALFIVLASSASAQVAKGNYYVGGLLNVNYDNAGSTKTYAFSTGTTYYTNDHLLNLTATPELGYFFSKNWSIGGQLIYNRTSGRETSVFYSNVSPANNFTTQDTYHTDFIGLAADMRYYHMFSDKFGFFSQFILVAENNLKSFSAGEFGIKVAPDFVFFPTKKLGITMGFGQVAVNTSYHFSNSTFALDLNNNISFGLNYYWGK